MANVYHWLTGSQTDLYSGVFLTASYGAQAVTGSSRYGSDSAWEIGTSTSSRATLYSGYNVSGPDALPNLGTGDITVAFWWQPNNSAYGGSGQRHLFQYSPGAALEVYHNASLSSDTQDDYNLYAQFRYGDGTTSKSKAFDIDLTGNPWIKVYASRISGAFYYTLFDATGSVITDNDGNPATWSDATQTGNIYEASSSTPHIRIGGDFAYGQTAGGIYDDIFLTLNHGIGTGSLETDSDGYAKIDPVINSFSTSAASATNGSSVTLSWDADFGTTLQLLKYVGGLLTNTETVTGQVSKSVTISETVSYKLRATNVYGSVDSESVQITLSNGGNNMAILSGSVILPVEVLGSIQVDGNGALSGTALPAGSLSGGDADVSAGKKLNSDASSFSLEASRKSVISALNALGGKVDLKIDLTSLSGGEMITHDGSGEFSINAAEFSASSDVRFDANLAAASTDDLSEGSNLYFTEARARASVSVTDAGGDGSLAYDNTTGVITYTGPSAAEVRAHFSAGEMIGITNGEIAIDGSVFSASSDVRFDAKLAAANTGDLAEGSNLYYTDARVRAAVSADDDLISFSDATGVFSTNASAFSGSWDVKMAAADTDALGEGSSNLYFTDARARAAISVTDAGGDGSMAYNSTTGVLTYTGPSAAEVQAHFSAGSSLDYNAGEFSLKVDDSTVAVNGSDKLEVKDGGITNAKLAGSIENEKLSNSTISGVSLGGTLGALSAAASGGITVSSYDGSAAVADLAVDKSQDFDWTGAHKFDEPLQLQDQDPSSSGTYYKLQVEDGLLKVILVP